MPSQLCPTCQGVLILQKHPEPSAARLSLTFRHHYLRKIRASIDASCYICRVLAEQFLTLQDTLRIDYDVKPYFTANPRRVRGRPGLLQLDFRLCSDPKSKRDDVLIATFVLKEHDQNAVPVPIRPVSDSTADPKVVDLAKGWIEECVHHHDDCRPPSGGDWHPSRLLYLGSLRNSSRTSERLRLVSRKPGEGSADQPRMNGHYLTLSHCWGSAPVSKLTTTNLTDMLARIELSKLPCTFQDAIKVACDLQADWLWIDALCIIQDGDRQKDWLEESALMDKVYSYSYCNISATDAIDGSEGLFRSRNQDWNWFETVNLKPTGIYRDAQHRIPCTILDPYFWAKTLDQAPVNVRSWVYQERLLAPRVLHWCKDQIAFECRQGNRAECRPDGMPLVRIKAGKIVDDIRLKSGKIEEARKLRALSMRTSSISKLASMVNEAEDRLYLYEFWRRDVQVYSKMQLTKEEDRLIALSGVARMLDERLKKANMRDDYVAGMWQNHMASQLLWFVNEGHGPDRQTCEDTRPKSYRAPSFSWASVETPRGVTFPRTVDALRWADSYKAASTISHSPNGMKVEVVVTRLIYRTEDKFGLLDEGGYIVLRGVLRKIRLSDHYPRQEAADRPAFDSRNENRYKWRLMHKGEPQGAYYEQVWLDSPVSEPSIFGRYAQTYCLPILQDDEHLWCLLVQAVDGDYGMRYQRIGMAKVPTRDQALLMNLTTPPGNNKTARADYYWGEKWKTGDKRGESTICIV